MLSHSQDAVRSETSRSRGSSAIAGLLGAEFDLLNLAAPQDGPFQEGGKVVAVQAGDRHCGELRMPVRRGLNRCPQPSRTSPSSLALFRRWARGRFIAAAEHFAALRVDHVDSGTRGAGRRCVSVESVIVSLTNGITSPEQSSRYSDTRTETSHC